MDRKEAISVMEHTYIVRSPSVPVFNEDAIQAAMHAIMEIECSIAALETVCRPGVEDILNGVFIKALSDKRKELIWVKKKLKELYDLQLLHLRASVLDHQRKIISFSGDHPEQEELTEVIKQLHIKTEATFNAKSKL